MAQTPAVVCSRAFLAGALLLAPGLSACQKPPDIERVQAEAALAAAGCDWREASDDCRRANDSLKAARAALGVQQGKMFPTYGRVRQLLADATRSAADAKRAAERQAAAKAELWVSKAEKALAEARQRFKRGDEGSFKADYGTPESDRQVFAFLHRSIQGEEGLEVKFNELGKLMDEARQALAGGNVGDAEAKAVTVLTELERYYPDIRASER